MPESMTDNSLRYSIYGHQRAYHNISWTAAGDEDFNVHRGNLGFNGKSIKEIAEAMKMSRVYARTVPTSKYQAQYRAGVKARQEAREKAHATTRFRRMNLRRTKGKYDSFMASDGEL